MKFNVIAKDLAGSLSQIVGICKAKSTVPILSHLLIEVNQGSLKLRATDLCIDLSVTLPIDTGENGSCCLNGSKLDEIVRNLNSADTMTIVADDGPGRAKIASGKSKFQLATRDTQDFPEEASLKAESSFSLEASVLHGLLSRAAYACAKEDTTSALNGVLVQVKGDWLTLATTNGHRMAEVTYPLGADVWPSKDISVILPSSSLKWLIGVLQKEGVITCALQKGNAAFVGANWNLALRSLEGPFPEYEYVIPKDFTRSVDVERELLIAALKRVNLMSDEVTNFVNLSIDETQIRLSSSNSSIGEAYEDIPCIMEGDNIEIGFNAKYLLDALNVMSAKEVGIGITDVLGAAAIREKDGRGEREVHVAMPVRIC